MSQQTMAAPPPPPSEPPADRPRLRKRRLRWVPRSWLELRAMATSWWYSAGGAELRLAFQDARRAPGWILFGAIAVCWPVTGWSLWPVIVAAVAWIVMWIVTGRFPWWVRRRARRWCRPLIGLLAFAWLAYEAWPWGWLLAVGLWLVVAGVTDTWRSRRRTLSWIRSGVANYARVDPGEIGAKHAQWQGRRLLYAEFLHSGALRTDEANRREALAQVVKWRLRHLGNYEVSWPAGITAFEVSATGALPEKVYERHWPNDLPGIPLGVTDEATAHLDVQERDDQTGEALVHLPLAISNPNDERNLGVIGGTGAGKTNFVRGYIARGLRHGWFPGGVIIIDGKGSSSYAPFVDRHGVLRIAREPEEWAEALQLASTMMRGRYDAQWAYETGQGAKPDLPRYLVVIEECQEVRAVLGKDADRFFDQLGRQIRESGGTLMLVTQRPDTDGAIPGPVRDQLEDWVILGFISATGARMVLDKDWRAVVDEYGEQTVRGRGMARLAGRLLRLQSFLLDSPRKVAEAEAFYPPKAGETGPEASQRATAAGGGSMSWAPREQPADGDSAAEKPAPEQPQQPAPAPPEPAPAEPVAGGQAEPAAAEPDAGARPDGGVPAEPTPPATEQAGDGQQGEQDGVPDEDIPRIGLAAPDDQPRRRGRRRTI